MAEPTQVKKYLAYWFQLGKKITISSQNKSLLPKTILNGHGYSSEFEKLWSLVTKDSYLDDCYLEGTNQTIRQLLSPRWEINDCARCGMPVPVIVLGTQSSPCVCDDLENWPNNQLPTPRSPVNNQQSLTKIQQSLLKKDKNQ